MTPATAASFAYHTLRMKAAKNYRVPFTTNIQLLLKCPFACLYCPQDHESNQALSLEVLRGVFRDARAMGGRRVHLTGGEPLLRKDLGEIIDDAKGLGFFVSLTTSGAKIDSQLDAIARADQVQLSFDGPDEARGLLRGDAASKTAAHAVEVMSERGIDFWTSTVLTKANMQHIDWVIEHAREHDIHANFVLMESHPEDWNDDNPMPQETLDLMPTQDDNREAVRQLVEHKRAGAPIGSSMPYLQELLEWSDYSQLTSPEKSSRYDCMAWQSQCEILADGRLIVCDDTLQRGLGVSVVEHGFRRAFELLAAPDNCNSCFSSCYLESNLIFSLNPQTVTNWARRLI